MARQGAAYGDERRTQTTTDKGCDVGTRTPEVQCPASGDIGQVACVHHLPASLPLPLCLIVAARAAHVPPDAPKGPHPHGHLPCCPIIPPPLSMFIDMDPIRLPLGAKPVGSGNEPEAPSTRERTRSCHGRVTALARAHTPHRPCRRRRTQPSCHTQAPGSHAPEGVTPMPWFCSSSKSTSSSIAAGAPQRCRRRPQQQ